jgi:hypothetical protein
MGVAEISSFNAVEGIDKTAIVAIVTDNDLNAEGT